MYQALGRDTMEYEAYSKLYNEMKSDKETTRELHTKTIELLNRVLDCKQLDDQGLVQEIEHHLKTLYKV